jgi:serine/threonine-protein kinase
VDFRTDIYSLGVVLFEVFTGTLPFKMDNPMATVLAHIQNPPPKPRSRNPKVSEDLEALILRCLEKDPASRYGRVADVLKDLTAVSASADASAA